jgi:sugar phosphate isomerase/epimerase
LRFGGRAHNAAELKQVAALGLAFAEISATRDGGLFDSPGELVRAAKRWGLTYLVHAPNEGDPCELERLEGTFFQKILRLIDLCADIRADLLTVHFWMDSRFLAEHVVRRKREIFARMARHGARKGVSVCLENLSERPEDLEPLMAACPEAGLTLDVGHGELFAPRNRAFEYIAQWPWWIRHVHVHDNLGGDRVEADRHLPIGEGVIDFPTIFAALIAAGYAGRVTLEVPLEDLEPSVRRLQGIIERCNRK